MGICEVEVEVCEIGFGKQKGSRRVHLFDGLQKIQNNTARLIYRSPKFNHVTPLLHTQRWLPNEKRIDFKLASLCFKSLNGSAPTYLSDLIYFYTPSRQLRSSADTRVFRIPSFRTKSVVSALSLTKLQQYGTSSPLLSVTYPLSVSSHLP